MEDADPATASVRNVPGSSRHSHALSPRIVAALLALVCVAPLTVAAFLTPSEAGHGTHTQLGMPACGWAQFFGKPCVTCGMTTAFAHTVRLDFVDAARDQPFGLLLAIGCGVSFWVMFHSAVTGSGAAWALGRWMCRPKVLWSIGALSLGAWIFKWVTW